MPEYPRDPARDGQSDPNGSWTPSPAESTGRRRRSLDDGGGTRVSDLLAKHGPGTRKFRASREAESANGHALPPNPASNGAAPNGSRPAGVDPQAFTSNGFGSNGSGTPEPPRNTPAPTTRNGSTGGRRSAPTPQPESRPSRHATAADAPTSLTPQGKPPATPSRRSRRRRAEPDAPPTQLTSPVPPPAASPVTPPPVTPPPAAKRSTPPAPAAPSATPPAASTPSAPPSVARPSTPPPGQSRSVDSPSQRRVQLPFRDTPSGRNVQLPGTESPSRRDLQPLSRREPESPRRADQPSRRGLPNPAGPDLDRPSRRDVNAVRRAAEPPAGDRGAPREPQPGRPVVDPPSRPGMPISLPGNGSRRSGRPQTAADGGPSGHSPEPLPDGAIENVLDGSGAGATRVTRAPKGLGPRSVPGMPNPLLKPNPNGGGPATDILSTAALDAERARQSGTRRGRPVPPPAPSITDQLNPGSPLLGRPRPPQPPPPTTQEITQEIPAARLRAAAMALGPTPAEACEERPARPPEELPKDDRVKAIDATLARFTAVHDELALEEAEARRTSIIGFFRRLLGMSEAEPEPSAAAEEADGPRDTRLREKKRKQRNRVGTTGKVLGLIGVVLVLIGAGYAWTAARSSGVEIREVAALDLNSADIQAKDKQQGDENFLIVGSDDRSGATPADNAGSSQDAPGARSDTIMLAHLPADRGRVTIVSFPRDLEIQRPACESWDQQSGKYGNQLPAAGKVKLNSAFAVGGPKCVTKVVQQLSGLAVNHFVGIDFQGFKSMVNAVHGVDVCLAQPMKDDLLGTIVADPSQGRLNADQALNYVRARHVAGDKTSDYGRIKRQQRFLSSFLRSAMAPSVLGNPTKLHDLVQAFSTSAFGDNIGVPAMVGLAQSVHGLDPSKVSMLTVPTTGTANQAGNETMRIEDAHVLFQAIIKGGPLPGDPGVPGNADPGAQAKPVSPTPPSTTIDPKLIKIQVLNATSRHGLAVQVADKLTDVGYQVMRVQDSTERPDTTVIRYAPQRADYAATLASSVPGAMMQVDPSLGGAIQLLIGPGFKGSVQAPNSDGSSTGPATATTGLPTTNGADTTCDSA